LDGDWLNVNSAHSVSVDWVTKYFPDATGEGALHFDDLRELLGTDRVGDTIVGRVAIRRYVEDGLLDRTGKRYSRVGCNKIVGEMDFLSNARGLPFTYCTSMDSYLDAHVKRAAAAHRDALEIARTARRERFARSFLKVSSQQ
jgi:hypothetical protein